MALLYTIAQVFRGRFVIPKKLYALLSDLDTRIADAEAGVVAAGSISSDELANGAVIEAKLGTGAVTSGKIADTSVTAAKLRGDIKSVTSAGVTITALTAAIADPATLPDGYIAVVKDSADTDKIKIVTVFGGVFYVSLAQTAAA